jgi:uric acid-xanthine permease
MSSSSVHKTQPAPTPGPTAQRSSARQTIVRLKQRWTTRQGWLGDYDYAWLCIPTLPFGNPGQRRMPPFYALETELPLFLAITSGLQHALAMLAGLITPPIIFASALSLDSATSAYMISASLIGCGKSFWILGFQVGETIEHLQAS